MVRCSLSIFQKSFLWLELLILPFLSSYHASPQPSCMCLTASPQHIIHEFLFSQFDLLGSDCRVKGENIAAMPHSLDCSTARAVNLWVDGVLMSAVCNLCPPYTCSCCSQYFGLFLWRCCKHVWEKQACLWSLYCWSSVHNKVPSTWVNTHFPLLLLIWVREQVKFVNCLKYLVPCTLFLILLPFWSRWNLLLLGNL